MCLAPGDVNTCIFDIAALHHLPPSTCMPSPLVPPLPRSPMLSPPPILSRSPLPLPFLSMLPPTLSSPPPSLLLHSLRHYLIPNGLPSPPATSPLSQPPLPAPLPPPPMFPFVPFPSLPQLLASAITRHTITTALAATLCTALAPTYHRTCSRTMPDGSGSLPVSSGIARLGPRRRAEPQSCAAATPSPLPPVPPRLLPLPAGPCCRRTPASCTKRCQVAVASCQCHLTSPSYLRARLRPSSPPRRLLPRRCLSLSLSFATPCHPLAACAMS